MRKRQLTVQMGKTKDQPEAPTMTPDEVEALVRKNARSVALYIAGGYILKRVLDTASEIAILAAKAKL